MPADPILALRKQTITAINARLAYLAKLAGDEPPTRAELAAELGLTRARLHQLENERASEFSLEALFRIALSLDMSVRVKLARPYSSA